MISDQRVTSDMEMPPSSRPPIRSPMQSPTRSPRRPVKRDSPSPRRPPPRYATYTVLLYFCYNSPDSWNGTLCFALLAFMSYLVFCVCYLFMYLFYLFTIFHINSNHANVFNAHKHRPVKRDSPSPRRPPRYAGTLLLPCFVLVCFV